ncbi:hypothetical protein [Streptomyces sp. TR06-5]|uniref:hypothetical protein n=1 Tax=unclassified Streptomyces TaxID=2593676 RepID=UPI0039A33B9F
MNRSTAATVLTALVIALALPVATLPASGAPGSSPAHSRVAVEASGYEPGDDSGWQ